MKRKYKWTTTWTIKTNKRFKKKKVKQTVKEQRINNMTTTKKKQTIHSTTETCFWNQVCHSNSSE